VSIHRAPPAAVAAADHMRQVHAVGEMMLEVGAPHGWGPQRLSAAQLQDVLDRLTAAAQEGSADVTLLRQGTTEVQAGGEGLDVQQDSLAAAANVWQSHAGACLSHGSPQRACLPAWRACDGSEGLTMAAGWLLASLVKCLGQ
jgi:hypothetical protein